MNDGLLRVWTVTDHDCVWPVGVASVVVAPDEVEARQLLDAALAERGLKGFDEDPYTLQRLDVERAHAVILRDGDY